MNVFPQTLPIGSGCASINTPSLRGSIRACFSTMITPQHLERIRTRVCDQEDGWGRPHVINEELFKRVLIRERKRADRSNQPFVLLLVDMNDGLGADSSSIWEAAIEALTAAKREMDILGWFERRAVIGLIIPEIRASDPANTWEGLDTRDHRELA